MDKIAIIEDDIALRELIEFTLQNKGYSVVSLECTKELFDYLDKDRIDLIIMDRNLPFMEGSNFVKEMREFGYNTPVIFLSAKDSNKDILEGFEKGGDDYITKPFDINELIARIKAVLKRTKKRSEILKHEEITYYPQKKELFINKQAVLLTPLEHRLLLTFLHNKNQLLSYHFLMQEVWNDDSMQIKSITVAIKRFRDKIKRYAKKDYIQSIRSQGYIFC